MRKNKLKELFKAGKPIINSWLATHLCVNPLWSRHVQRTQSDDVGQGRDHHLDPVSCVEGSQDLWSRGR